MKGTIKKILAFFMTAVIAVCALSVKASAESKADRAKTIKNGTTYSGTLRKTSVIYKVTLKEDGKLKLKIGINADRTNLYLYDLVSICA